MSVVERALDHPRGTSRLLIGQHAVATAADRLAPWLRDRTVFVLSTPRVRGLWGAAIATLVAPAARCVALEVEDGEGAKTLAHAERLWRAMLAAGGKRDSRLITLGGGTVGDLGGFVAGCFLRGIAYAQVPTTLLAQVDASVGGKTGVDLPGGKNTVGLFHHPDWVVADTTVLRTLEAGELRSGLIEAIKMAFVLDPPFFARIEADLEGLVAGDAEALEQVVVGSVDAKAAVVARDPEEGDARRLLNFGHTLGHAIEAALGYRDLRHGEAVAYGMLFALALSRARGLPERDAARLRAVLRRLELPLLPRLDVARLLDLMRGDKKAREGGLVWVLVRALGEGVMVDDLGAEVVAAALERFFIDPWRRVQ